MINNIIFDLGGVIVTIDQSEAVARFKSLGLKDADEQLNPYTQSGIFGDLEAGRIDGDAFRRELSKMIGREVSYEECKYAWLGYRKDVPKRNLEVLRKLRNQGFRIILLSNTNEFMMDWAESNEFDGEGHNLSYFFDSLYKSYEVKIMKPDEMFFRHVMSKEQIYPDDTLFVDDGPRNVAAASELGIHTFCPKNGCDWTEEIFTYLK